MTPVGCSAIPEYSFTKSAVDAVVAVVTVSTHPRRVKLVTVQGVEVSAAQFTLHDPGIARTGTGQLQHNPWSMVRHKWCSVVPHPGIASH